MTLSREQRLQENDIIVESLAGALAEGKHGLAVVPGLIKRLLLEEAWRERIIHKNGKLPQFDSFPEFVETPPLEGLGTDLALIRNLVRGDSEATDLLDRALQGRPGRPKKETLDNVKGFPSGNAEDAALRRLRKDRPDLHERVLDGKLSAHRAMLMAGFRRPTATVYVDSPEAAVKGLLRRFSRDEIVEALERL